MVAIPKHLSSNFESNNEDFVHAGISAENIISTLSRITTKIASLLHLFEVPSTDSTAALAKRYYDNDTTFTLARGIAIGAGFAAGVVITAFLIWLLHFRYKREVHKNMVRKVRQIRAQKEQQMEMERQKEPNKIPEPEPCKKLKSSCCDSIHTAGGSAFDSEANIMCAERKPEVLNESYNVFTYIGQLCTGRARGSGQEEFYAAGYTYADIRPPPPSKD